MLVKKTYRLNEKTAENVARLAEEQGSTETQVMEKAIRCYSDYVYMKENATVIPQEILRVFQASIAVMEKQVNNRSNQLLSAIAIELGVLEQVIASSLDVRRMNLEEYRRNAVDFLKANQRVFRLDEVAE